jgi:hypothetical protein
MRLKGEVKFMSAKFGVHAIQLENPVSSGEKDHNAIRF